MSPLVEPACVCREPGCGIQYAYVPGLTESRDCCYFCSQRKRRVRQAAEDGDRARNDGEEAAPDEGGASRMTAPYLEDVPLPDRPRAETAAGGPSANRGMPQRWPGAVRDTSTPGLFRRVSMSDSDDLGGPPRGCLLALALSCAFWALLLLCWAWWPR